MEGQEPKTDQLKAAALSFDEARDMASRLMARGGGGAWRKDSGACPQTQCNDSSRPIPDRLPSGSQSGAGNPGESVQGCFPYICLSLSDTGKVLEPDIGEQ